LTSEPPKSDDATHARGTGLRVWHCLVSNNQFGPDDRTIRYIWSSNCCRPVLSGAIWSSNNLVRLCFSENLIAHFGCMREPW